MPSPFQFGNCRFDFLLLFNFNSSMITLYGITNCQTVAKARTWLESQKIEYTFWDYKKQGIDTEQLTRWCDELGWEKVLNRAGMMWRKASEAEKEKVVDQQSAIEFMFQVPNSIKRPIIETENGLLLGFVEKDYMEKFIS
jgi:arsenate reductase (glutaredoxin)